MKKLDLGQSISILANLGVIAGIIVLVFEVRQNNDLLASQARANLTANRIVLQQSIVENAGGLADIIEKDISGEPISSVEGLRLAVYQSMTLNNFASMHQEMLTGPLTEEDLPIGQWRAVFNEGGMQRFWDSTKDAHTPEFVHFIDTQIIPFADE